jgi:RimJ/RimL family protein N-acetyltransferase
MDHGISLKKMGFRTALPKAREFYNVLSNNRERLAPWFWWMDEKITPNLQKSVIFMILYIFDTKRKKIIHKFSNKKPYDEQFFVMVNGKLGGMVGLDDINNLKQDSEIWYFVTSENESRLIASSVISILENYAVDTKKLNSLYVKTADGNIRSENLLRRNNYEIEKVEYGVPTSKRNPKITNLTTWRKYLGR